MFPGGTASLLLPDNNWHNAINAIMIKGRLMYIGFALNRFEEFVRNCLLKIFFFVKKK